MALLLEPGLASARVGGRQVAWRQAGSGPGLPLLLLHGIGSNARSWEPELYRFARGRTVIAWNAPGYAGSTRLPQSHPSADDYARAALALLDHLGIARCIVVAQSLGAIMGTALALIAPERVAGLVLVSPAIGHGTLPGAPLSEPATRRIAEMAALGPEALAEARAGRLLGPTASEAARAIVRRAMGELIPEGYDQAVRLLSASNLLEMAVDLAVPALVIWGSADIVTPPVACRRVAAAIAGADTLEIVDAGHAIATEAPAAFLDALEQFISKVESDGASWI